MGKVKSELATEEDFERIERESLDPDPTEWKELSRRVERESKKYFKSNKSYFEEPLEWKSTESREEYEHWLDTVDDWPEGIDGD